MDRCEVHEKSQYNEQVVHFESTAFPHPHGQVQTDDGNASSLKCACDAELRPDGVLPG